MYKIIEQFNPIVDKIVYTVLDNNNKELLKTTSKTYAENIIKEWENFNKEVK